MHPKFLMAAALSAFAGAATANTDPAPYAMTATHADMLAQLREVAAMPDATGTAAGRAADLMARHNAAQEQLVLPLLGWADATASRQALTAADLPVRAGGLEAELSQLHAGDVDLVTALVELYATAEETGQPGVARLAERMIWHETGDVEILYPAALLVGRTAQAR